MKTNTLLKSIIVLVISCFNTQLKSQSPFANYNHWIATNGSINCLTQDANYIYAGGNFSYVGPPTGCAAKITTANINPDLTYCRPNGFVRTVISDGAGGWYIGGNFTTISTSSSTAVARNRIAHILSNGQLDVIWNPNADNAVFSIVLSGSDLFVGGLFTNIGGQARNCIAKLSATGTGTADAIWNPNAGNNNIVMSFALSGNDLFVGGLFNNIGGQNRNGLAKLSAIGSGTADITWDPNPDFGSWISALVLSGNDLFVGGAGFSLIGGQSRNNIAKLSATGTGLADALWNPNAGSNGMVESFALSGSNLYVGGAFSNIGGQANNNIAKLSTTGTGTADPTWNPNANATVRSIALSPGNVYLGGAFVSVGGYNRSRIARFNKTTGEADAIWNPNANDQINALALSGSDLYAAGTFTNIGGQTRNRIAKLTTSGTGLADAAWNPNADNKVESILLSGNDLFVGGAFTNIGSWPRNRIAKLTTSGTGSADATWNPNADSIVYALDLLGNDLFVGGGFTNIGGQARSKIAKISASGTGVAEATWNPNANNQVNGFSISGSDLFVFGGFSNIGGQPRNYIAKLTTSGTGIADAAWNTNANGGVKSVAVLGSELLVGGSFSNIGGQPRNNIAKVSTTGTGSADITWNPNSNDVVRALLFSINNLYLGGSFGMIGGVGPRNGLALIGNLCSGPTTPVLSVSNATICLGQSGNLTISNGTLNGATNWQWYNGGCGAGSVGSGTAITVTPTINTTYYVRGEGGCVGLAANCTTLAVTVNACTGLNETEHATNSLRIFPNPAKEQLNISISNTAVMGKTYSITNTLGQVVATGVFNKQIMELSIQQLSAGLYQLNIDGMQEKYKFIKE